MLQETVWGGRHGRGASASSREAALNIYCDLRVEEVRKARFEDRFRRMAEPQVEDRPEWRVPPEESRRTFQEVQKQYDDDCVRRESERCARCNLWL